MKTKSDKPLRTTFTAMYTDVMNSEAWKAMTKPIGAKVLLLEMKALYNRKTEAAVPMSVRYAAKLLRIHTQLAGQCLDALEHYGFIKETKRGYLGVDGCGLATEWQLTDEKYLGNPATLDFKRWKGTPYQPPKLKARSDNHHRPVVKFTTPRSDNHHRPVKKARKYGNFAIQPPVVKINTHLKVYPSSTPAAGLEAGGDDAPAEFGIGHNAGPPWTETAAEEADDLSIPEFPWRI